MRGVNCLPGRLHVALLATLCLVVSCSTAGATTEYEVIDLWSGSYGAYSVNNSGQVVGEGRQPGGYLRGFLWENGVVQELDPLGGHGSGAAAINAAGRIAGWAQIPGDDYHACVWIGGVPSDVGSLGVGLYSYARDINALGHVVGRVELDPDTYCWHASLWDGGPLQDLGTLGGLGSGANGINALGQIVGGADTAADESHAFLWENGVMHDLGTFGGSSSTAYDINALGQIVGQAENADGRDRACLWENGSMTNLGTVGGLYSSALAINALGQVVGRSGTASGSGRPHAFLWEDGVMVDLNDLLPEGSGWVLNDAYDINDLGWIVGVGEHDGDICAFLLRPIPEPSALGVLGLAFLAVLTRLRRGRGRA